MNTEPSAGGNMRMLSWRGDHSVTDLEESYLFIETMIPANI